MELEGWKGRVGMKIERIAEWRRICFHRISNLTSLFSLPTCGGMEVGRIQRNMPLHFHFTF
jgi:hypothetical protein